MNVSTSRPEAARTRYKPRSSTRIAIGFVIILAALYFGFKAYSSYRVDGMSFTPLTPGKLNIVGVDTGAGFQIIVANQIAQLVQASESEFEAESSGQGGATQGADKKRIPVREMLQSLDGDERGLSELVMILNKLKKEDLPPVPVYWTAAELEAALAGDERLERKLVRDLNVELDGTPLDVVSVNALQNGIVIKAPVPVAVAVKGQLKTLTATIVVEYRPWLMRAVEARYKEKATVTREMIKGYYIEESRRVIEKPALKENVRASLRSMIRPERLKGYAEYPEKVLRSAKVIVNENLVEGASYRSYDSSKGKLHDLKIQLTDEGRNRLWQFSKGRVGSQLLLIVNGVAIAAPHIRHELAQSELVITQMPDELLVREAVDVIQKNSKRAN